MTATNSIDLYSVQSKPTCTIVIPVAILVEPPEQVVHAVNEIMRSAMSVGPIQVILWCNATTNTSQKTANQHFRQLLKEIVQQTKLSTAGLRLVLDMLPNRFPPTALGQVKKIKQVRTNYMNAIIDEWRKGKIEADHPIVWFDADTTFIDPVTIPAMLQAVKDNRAYFIKGRMTYTGRVADTRAIAPSSAAERVAMIYGTIHALLEDTLGPYDPREYVDECGLAFKLSTYVAAGGLARSRGPVQGESRVLLRRAKAKLKAHIPLLVYISSARHGTHYRRFQALAQYVTPDKLPEQNGELYLLSTDIIRSDSNAVHIRQTEVLLMLKAMLQRHITLHSKNPLLPSQVRAINDLVLLAFPEDISTPHPKRLTELLRYKNIYSSICRYRIISWQPLVDVLRNFKE